MIMNLTKKLFIILLSFVCSINMIAQESKEKSVLEYTLDGFKFRSIGPAFMSGRIADIAIDHYNENVWYVAVGSGGLWKTANSGTTWIPLTDKESFYSTGCVTIDPHNSEKIWLGTGENVGGRHVGIGHGLLVSEDGGKTWKNLGLKKSEHISKIIVHPKDPNTIWVAVQGPLWSSGGERGLYKSIDGGKIWKNTLNINKWTGVTDLVIDASNPDILYAASWQRHRNVAAYMGGGPGTSLHKSIDGGKNWFKIDNGLPKSSMGKIGLAISPMKSNVLYAAIELDHRKGAIYKSTNSGGSWIKMSDTVSGGTGPHYYQELVASPHQFDKIFLMNVRALVSEDGGKSFYTMKEQNKHSDNHALVFKAKDPNYLLFGCDGGLYESFDNTNNWKFVNNLPLTQFYKLAVDDATPFYNIYGGTQDNNTQGGPSRTLKSNGISNSDWYVLLGGDGHQPATEPGNPDIVYAQWQQGNLYRIDKTTGEATYIKPQNRLGEVYERYNWDSPILVSHHDPKRLYFGTQRVWRSDNRGDSWNPVSSDLTKNEERLSLPIMGKQQSFDNAWDVYAMSTYNTITSLAESKLNENILYAGTDDGILQMTKDGGNNWTKMTVNQLPGVPQSAFVNDIKADLFNENVAYVALDNHKFGDYKPYLFKTTNGGKKWTSITMGIPDNTLIWRLVQDHVNPNLLFLATEYGVYVSFDQGNQWHKFSNGLPTISVRDLVIQKRENDLVLATFGRGFYVLDDYSALRNISKSSLEQDGVLFQPRTALQYQPLIGGTSSQGASFFTSKNPEYGALIRYFIKDDSPSNKTKRQESEKELKDVNIPFPGWDALDNEMVESGNDAIIVIRDSAENIIDQLTQPLKKGMNYINWDLKQPFGTTVNANSKNKQIETWRFNVKGGNYTAQLYKRVAERTVQLSNPVAFKVKRIRTNVLTNPLAGETEAYTQKLIALSKELSKAEHSFDKASKQLEKFEKILKFTTSNQATLTEQIYALRTEMHALKLQLKGSAAKSEVGEKEQLSIGYRIYFAASGLNNNSYGQTKLHMESYDMAKTMFEELKPKLEQFSSVKVPALGKKLESSGAPAVLD